MSDDGKTVAWVACAGAPVRCRAQIHGGEPGPALDSVTRLWLSSGSAPRLAFVAMPDEALDAPLDPSFLEETPIFGGLEGPSLERVAEHLTRRVLPPASLVVAEGDGAREMYVVERGEVEVLLLGSDAGDGDVVLAVLHRGDCFGEMSLLDIQPRPATVRTRGEASLLVLRDRELLTLRNRDVDAFVLLVTNVAREVSRRLRARQRVLLDLRHEVHEAHRQRIQEVFGSPRT